MDVKIMKEEDALKMINFIVDYLKPRLKYAEHMPCPLCKEPALVLQSADSMRTDCVVYCAKEGKVLRVDVQMIHEVY
jgi:hypothetical protein